MMSSEEMIGLQAEKHELVKTKEFSSKEEFILHLMHTVAYSTVSTLIKNKTVLDLGCNIGYGSNILKGNAANVIGVDVSTSAIESAVRQFLCEGLDFKVIDGKSLPFNDDTFDYVISCEVIEHIVDTKQYIYEIKRVLKDRGSVVFTTPNAKLRLDPGMKPWNKFHVREYNSSEIRDLLSGYFTHVKVLGLFAENEVDKIERNRVTKARHSARSIQRKPSFVSRSTSLIPWRIQRILLKYYERILSLFEKHRLITIVKKYDVNSFYYSDENIDEALDFMVICSDTELQAVLQKIATPAH